MSTSTMSVVPPNIGQLKNDVPPEHWLITTRDEVRSAEDDEILAQKSDRAIEAGLKIIYCVSDKNDRVPDGVDIVAYEPVWAIGTGKAATAQEAEETASAIKSKHPKVSRILYGGSVNPDNIVEFLKMPTIGGVLPGKTSLDPDQFFRMLKNAAE